MTYLEFHLVFILPPILVLAFVQTRPLAGVPPPEALKWLGAVLAIAFVYTTPWDNFLVASEVWGYPPGRVLATIGYVPVEEYAFFLLQPILTGLLYFALRGRGILPPKPERQPTWFRPFLVSSWFALTAIGVWCLVLGDRALYMGLILAWASPVIAGLSWIGADKVWGDRRRVATAITVSSVYLWFADRTAIALDIWYIADATSLGFDPLGLPIEEATFFVVTNVLCTFGLALFLPDPTDP